MATENDTYSRIIAWLKVLLPVAGLILLSVMFLIARSIDPNVALNYADVDVKELAREQRISRPSFSGVTSDGAAITFTAEAAKPDQNNPTRYSATGLSARIETPDGAVLNIEARDAVMDGTANRLDLTGGVSLVTSTEYQIRGEGLSARLDATWVETRGAVTAVGPPGQIEAGHVKLSRQDGEGSPYLLVFNRGVKLVYTPPKRQVQ